MIFFCSVFTSEEDGDIPTAPHIFEGVPLVDVDISPQKVEAKLTALKPTSSPGPDGIHSRVLWEVSNVLAGPLSTLFWKPIELCSVTSQLRGGSTRAAESTIFK